MCIRDSRYAVVVVFQLVTLPVEFNASSRAMTYMNTIGLPQAEQGGAFAVLRLSLIHI